MSENDKKVLNAIINPNTPFEDEKNDLQTLSKYDINDAIIEAKKYEVEGIKSAEKKDLKRSIEYFNKAIEIAPDWASSYNNRAQAFRLFGDMDEQITIETLNERHRHEKKDLQSKIQSLKKSVTKGDKKKKKEVDAEIEILEKNFEEKCKLDLKEFEDKKKTQIIEPNDKTKSTQNDNLESEEVELQEKILTKQSKSKKRKEKKEKGEQDRENLINLQEIENKKGPAFLELTKINEKLKAKGLKIKDVISDGNCMYYAVADQLSKHLFQSKTCQQLRELTCEYMLSNSNEFQPYLCSEDGDILDEEKYKEYCLNIRNSLVWGSQVELKALCDALNVVIEVIQGEGSELILGETNEERKRLVITFHRHMLSSCHYNSTEDDVKISEDCDL